MKSVTRRALLTWRASWMAGIEGASIPEPAMRMMMKVLAPPRR